MATPGRRTLPPLINQLFETGSRFEFHAAMKLLGGISYNATQIAPHFNRFQEKVFLKTNPSFSHTGTDIFKITPPLDRGSVPEIYVNFFGLDTRQGPLPDPYIEQLLAYQGRHQTALYDFLSIFNNRLIHALHDIRKKYWIGIDILPPEKTLYGKSLASFAGLKEGIAKIDQLPSRTLLFYAGLLWQKPRSKTGLTKILSDFLKAPVALQEFLGAWVKIPKDQQTNIGKSGQFQSLSKDALVGKRFWDQQKTFGLKIGPLSFNQFKGLLKTTDLFQYLRSITQFYQGSPKEFQVRLQLKKEEVPATLLGKGSQLGWTSFLQQKPLSTDPPLVRFSSSPFMPPEGIHG